MYNFQNLHRQAIQLINQRQFIQAHPICVQLVKLDPNFADGYFLLGMINVEVGQISKANQLVEKAISIEKKDEYIAQLAKIYALQGALNDVSELLHSLCVEDLDDALSLDTFGVALSHVGFYQEAIPFYEKAIKRDTTKASFHYNLGIAYKFLGQVNAARGCFEKAIYLDGMYYKAFFALADLGGIDRHNNHLEQLESLLEHDKLPLEGQLHIAHAMAKECEALKDYDQAFDVLQSAKTKKRISLSYEFKQDQALFDHVRAMHIQREDDARVKEQVEGHPSNQPIFIVGMPRSGTTLVERIITGHNEVHSAGELQDFGIAVKELSKTASNRVLDVDTLSVAQGIDKAQLGRRYMERTKAVHGRGRHFVDKLPFNFYYIHLIRQALPNAKIICLRRNGMDTCIGNYRQLFSINSPYYFYSYDLLTTGKFYSAFHHLLSDIEKSHDDNIKVVDYEALVRDPLNQGKDLVEFCNLDWQPEYVDIEKNTAPVSTASNMQVREPINQRFLARWKNYESHLEPLKSLFDQQGIPY
jgi:tetratricopeptide (TPR) repeat protein